MQDAAADSGPYAGETAAGLREAFPDPVLSANVYCAGRLDAVVYRAVAPFWRELSRADPERLCYLWLMRYGRGGEHLKIRVHGPKSRQLGLRTRLAEKVTAALASLPPLAAPPPGRRDKAPPIDVEDADGDHPDSTLLWTTYRRSPLSLGGPPFLADDRYVARLTRCLASGCERVLALAPEESGGPSHSLRQRTLLGALISGLAPLGFSVEERAEYLAYHRDWLLRFTLPADRRCEGELVVQLCRRFDGRIDGMRGSLRPLAVAAESAWNARPGAPAERQDGAWRRSLADLLELVSPLCRDPAYRLDPFASDPVFAPIFKVFHGLANQLGLGQADEAFIHHLLFRIAAGDLP